MPLGSHVPRRCATVALSFACLALAAACGSSIKSATSSGTTPSSNTGTSTTTSAPVGTGAVPSSCSAIPVSVISPYIGGVATTRSVGQPPHGVSCEFANANASKIVILNIGGGATPASFAALRAVSGQAGRTVTSISGLGSSAFSISKNGVPGGVDALTAQGQVFSVAANLPIAQDEALIEQLMKLF